MLRMKTSVAVKLGLLVIVLILLGPVLFHLKLTENVEDDAELYRQWQQKKRLKAKHESKSSDVTEGGHESDTVIRFASESPKMTSLISGTRGNFEPPEREIKSQPGENGVAVQLSESEKVLAERSTREYGYSMVASDKVAMDRVIPDTRLEECKYWHYPLLQPTASVVLVFHNEAFSALVRTIHSVINTSPPQLLKEVVLVDDFSDKEHLKTKLSDYITKEFKGLVKLYRNTQREGLIRTRSRGAELSTGDVVVFLDSHCECNRNWLVPLLDRIRVNRKTLAIPIVDSISHDTMEYTVVYSDTHFRGIFEWGFFYKETEVPQKELARRQHNSEPYRSPTHAGGLFAVDRKYFAEIGGYDPGLKIWGGENYELSFKVWQCGGAVEWVPCSRVGHIYRTHMPYSLGQDTDPYMSPIYINYMRVVEVWMEEEFKEYFYTREPSFRGYPFGNITQQLQFKKEHNCQSFVWFMENIAYDVFVKYPKPPPNKAWGQIRRRGTNMCWDSGSEEVGKSTLVLRHCHKRGASQMFRLNVEGQIGLGERCILARNTDALVVSLCITQPVGPWDWDKDTGLIQNKALNRCVAAGTDNSLHLQPCQSDSDSFQWDIEEVFPWKRS